MIDGHGTTPLQQVEERLDGLGKKRGVSGTWQCPAHEDRTPSLSVSAGDAGNVVLHCHAGCPANDVAEALGFAMRDLFPPRPQAEKRRSERPTASRGAPQRVARYVYHDREGEPLRQKVRWEPGLDGRKKSFTWEMPDGSKAPKGEGSPDVLLALPLVREADLVHLCEGEKAALQIMDAVKEVVATCPPAGWKDEYAQELAGKEVILWQDRDGPGRQKTLKAYKSLLSVAASVRIVESATEGEHDDAFDHLAAGFVLEQALPIDPWTCDAAEALPFIHSGEAIRELRKIETPKPIIEGLLYPGSTSALVAAPFVGKTWFLLNLASALAAGAAPWPGTDPLQRGRVVYLSYDLQTRADYLAKRLRHLDQFRHDQMRPDSYLDHLTIVGASPGNPFPAERYKIDVEGLERLREEILDPISGEEGLALIVFDTLSSCLPQGVDENSNSDMPLIMQRLEQLALGTGAAVLIVHHVPKPARNAKEDTEPWAAGRGAGAIAGSAAALGVLERVKDHGNLRRLRCVTNLGPGIPSRFFSVRPDGEDERDEILYWRPAPDPANAGSMEGLDAWRVLEAGEELNSRELAVRLTERDFARNLEEAKTVIPGLRKRWETEGQVTVADGPRRSILTSLQCGETH